MLKTLTKSISLILLLTQLTQLAACGGGSNSSATADLSPAPDTDTGDTPEAVQSLVWQEATPESVGMNSALLAQTFDQAFVDGSYTQAALVIKDDKLIYERYRGILPTEATNLAATTDLDSQAVYGTRDKDSLATSWSTAKSFTSVLIAIAIEQGLIESLTEPASTYIEEWQGDDRAAITIRNLLDMRSGLPLVCYDTAAQSLGVCDNAGSAGGDLVFANNQMSACINRPLAETNVNQPWHNTGIIWQDGYWLYSNCDTMVLGEILYRATGQDLQTYADLHLFSKIGMRAQWWRDNDGTSQVDGNYLAYCCLDATPRDFARFGQLLLNNGVWDGEQVIPSAYVDSIKNITLDSVVTEISGGIFSYGLKFWSIIPQNQDDGVIYPPPNTLISTTGFDGQYITVDFDNNIVMVRNGLYSPILNASDGRKMTISTGDFAASSLIGSLPNGVALAGGSSYVHQKFLYGVNQSIISSD
jgi:CubicO group peptidase (beta-lactamase class C family)